MDAKKKRTKRRRKEKIRSRLKNKCCLPQQFVVPGVISLWMCLLWGFLSPTPMYYEAGHFLYWSRASQEIFCCQSISHAVPDHSPWQAFQCRISSKPVGGGSRALRLGLPQSLPLNVPTLSHCPFFTKNVLIKGNQDLEGVIQTHWRALPSLCRRCGQALPLLPVALQG